MPSELLWNRVTVDLSGLQDRISTLKRYFESAGEMETAEKLEKAIQLLMEIVVIALLDDDSSVTYATLHEAIAAARTWYIILAGDKLPAWTYNVENVRSFSRAVQDHKVKIAEALGCSVNRLPLALTNCYLDRTFTTIRRIAPTRHECVAHMLAPCIVGKTDTEVVKQMDLQNKTPPCGGVLSD